MPVAPPAARTAAIGARRRRWRPYPFEIAAWASLAAAVLFLRGNGLRIDWNTVAYTVPPLFRPTAQALLAGPLLYAAYALDGYVGIGIASLSYWAAWRLDAEPSDGAPPPAAAPEPGAGA